MAYLNLLDILRGLTVVEMKSQQLEEYNRHAEAQRSCFYENWVVGEGIFGTQLDVNDDKLLETTIGTLRGQSEIAGEARRHGEQSMG